MNLLNKILILLFASAAYLLGQDCTSLISVQTDEPSAKIYLNNEIIGEGKAEKELGKGAYSLYVAKNSSAWNPISFADSVIINECGIVKLYNYSFKNSVYLQSDPADSYVYSNDTLIGYTPLFVPLKHQSFRLSKPGYADELVKADELRAKQVINLTYTGEEEEPLFIHKDIFKILVGSAAVLGGLTAYFKLKADKHFEDYEFSGAQEDLDQTRKYDLISGITFGALQINFGVLIYYFLIE